MKQPLSIILPHRRYPHARICRPGSHIGPCVISAICVVRVEAAGFVLGLEDESTVRGLAAPCCTALQMQSSLPSDRAQGPARYGSMEMTRAGRRPARRGGLPVLLQRLHVSGGRKSPEQRSSDRQ
ncbi:hypothetical protein GHT09_002314 [Marmota monax]|uniref:Uncharacterized protein n=1 Tax=Marmota monax TaxID=9995 RepID=A0A834V715_MARMO|nr:hypothetical protein GHT09_002314 [Marmota monax]